MSVADVAFSGSQTEARRPSRAAEGDVIRAKELSLKIRAAAAGAVVVLTGRVTVDSSPQLRAVLHAVIGAGGSRVTIDFTNASYLDTSAVATLLEAATLAFQRRVTLLMTGLSGDARIVAERAELDRIFAALGYEVQFA